MKQLISYFLFCSSASMWPHRGSSKQAEIIIIIIIIITTNVFVTASVV
jgi:hypothetical protein